MRAAAVTIGLIVLLAGCASAGGQESVTPAAYRPSLRHVFVITETAGFRHGSIGDGVSALRAAARTDGRYDVTVLPRASLLRADRLERAGALVFMLTSGELAVDAAWKRRLLAYVRRGGGLVGFHSASDTFHSWPTWARMLGGEFADHPHRGVGRVVVGDRRHPATRRLPRAFRIAEEFYNFKTDPRRRAHVLARLDVASFGGSAEEDRPLVWCRREGRGRVVYDALGHNPATWHEIHQRRLLAGATAWAAGLPGARSACG